MSKQVTKFNIDGNADDAGKAYDCGTLDIYESCDGLNCYRCRVAKSIICKLPITEKHTKYFMTFKERNTANTPTDVDLKQLESMTCNLANCYRCRRPEILTVPDKMPKLNTVPLRTMPFSEKPYYQ